MDRSRTDSFGKAGAINPVLPYFLLVLALLAMGLWRIASTDPQWKDAKPLDVAVRNQEESDGPEIKSLDETKLAPSNLQTPPAPEPAVAVVPAVEPKPVATPASTPASVQRATPSSTATGVDSYLSSHLGQQIPFLYKGQKRLVTLVAFTDDAVTIKTKKTLTLNRKDLSDEQLKLWK